MAYRPEWTNRSISLLKLQTARNFSGSRQSIGPFEAVKPDYNPQFINWMLSPTLGLVVQPNIQASPEHQLMAIITSNSD